MTATILLVMLVILGLKVSGILGPDSRFISFSALRIIRGVCPVEFTPEMLVV